MIFGARIQIDNRPAVDHCSIINIETGIKTLSRIVVENGDYDTEEGEGEEYQGIDISYADTLLLASVFIEFFEGRTERYQLEPDWQIHDGLHNLSIAIGLEGMLSFTVSYSEDPNPDVNRSVCVLIRRNEALPIAYALKACAESRKLADSAMDLEEDIGR